MNDLSGKVIIVTGGYGLIGKAIVKDLVHNKATVINAEKAAETDINSGLVNCDITDANSVDSMLGIVKDKFGKIDGLVNNAYPYTPDWGTKFEHIPLESWKKNVDMQLNSCFYLCQQVLNIMQEQRSGSIVNIASIYGVVGNDFTVYENTEGMTSPAAYSAIKGAVINFTRYLASYYGGYNVRVNCVSPGGVFNHQHEAFVKNYERKVPMKRMGTPADVAPAVSFLLSEGASYITGHNLLVDGGWTCI
jgi:NAD(P)-dependent dehydrogenase (short-subunit alcohol dehydrogenase family)